MKKERYFRDELRRLFMYYAIIPAAAITVVCGLVFMAALVYGKMSNNSRHNAYVAEVLDSTLAGYEEELNNLAARSELFMGEPDTALRSEVFEEFYQVSNHLGYEADIYILDRERRLLLSNRQTIPQGLTNGAQWSWGMFGSMDRAAGETAIRLVNVLDGQESAIAMGRAVRGRGYEGYLLFTIANSQFQPALDRSDSQTIITDRFGWVFLSNNSSLTDNGQVSDRLRDANGYLSNEMHLYLAKKSSACGGRFFVYSAADIQNIVFSLTFSGTLVITALVLMGIWVLFSSKKVTEKKTRDFYRILDVMEKARDGNLDSAIEIESDNEFAIIADAYNEMIESLKRQMDNNRKMAELVAAAQNKQLESQFNPHFLYNTLENIRYMCKIEPEIAQKMVLGLSSLLRYSMDGGPAEVTLKEDLDYLENYLTILRYRFNRRFSYRIDVEPEALGCRIPKLVVQPMIENAVKYGFGNQEQLSVELKAYLHEGKLILICRDDGVGMTPTVLRELTELLKKEENTSRHSGLYNIHRRIVLLYGSPYGVEIRSAEGHGTTFVVTLPAHREEEMRNEPESDAGTDR